MKQARQNKNFRKLWGRCTIAYDYDNINLESTKTTNVIKKVARYGQFHTDSDYEVRQEVVL
ncbi:hypothetical protein [Streptococcus suis]|uniref:hypothetical protein n=1 Tax=Streptococcus suis TaxID=1307 RepID=UPI0013895096|nr:hypothetical protein [Streptococcus suis]